ncbi:MAG: response regulator [Bacteroidetes bacterium]|jgi:CheY-like chemotaxis protein|nr:response regulator [Bacteroidota bacterium]
MKKTILLVEDDELDIISVERSLKKIGVDYELITAYNGIEALDKLRGSQKHAQMQPLPDIILLDINMPKMNGLQFLSVIREDPALKHLKVIIMTTSGEEHDRSATERLGISGYLIKPLNFNNNSRKPDSMEGFVQFHLRHILGNLD